MTGLVLVVEDDEALRESVCELLQESGFEAASAPNGAAALAYLRSSQRRPSVILLDLMMPVMSGGQFREEQRRDPALCQIPVVVMSATRDVEGLEADEVLHKPMKLERLLSVVGRFAGAPVPKVAPPFTAGVDELWMQAPLPLCVLRGPRLVFEMANPLYCQLAGKQELVGQSVYEALPEIKAQGFDQFLLGVMKTGEPFIGREMHLRLDRDGDGVLEDGYYTFIYAPIREPDGTIDRVIAVVHDVTDQVLARQAVERSEEKHRSIVAQVEAGIAQTDLTGRFTLINERFCEMTGWSEEALKGQRMQDLTHPDDLAESVRHFQLLVERGTPFVVEKRYVRPDGSFVWSQSSVSRIDDDRGRPVGVAAVAIDITQRRQAQRALAESEQRFRAMADSAPVMVWVTEPDGRCTYLNKTWFEVTGQDPVTALGFGWIEALHPDDRARTEAVFFEANARHEAFRVEYRLRRCDGQYRWAIDSAAPRFGEHGEFLGYVGSVIDISERYAHEQALGISEARYRQMFEVAEISLWEEDFSLIKRRIDELAATHGPNLRAHLLEHPEVVNDAVGLVKVLNVNPATLRLLGAERKDQVLGSLHQIFVPETMPLFIDEMIAIAEGHPRFAGDTVIRKLDGSLLEVTVSFGRPADEEGWGRVNITLTDISLMKGAERRQDARLGEMEQALRFSDLFIGVLGHDLRNPLSAISAAAAVLQVRADNELVTAPVGRILRSATRMERMISQLLDFARIRFGQGLPLTRGSVDLNELSRAIIDELQPVHGQDIHLETYGDAAGTGDADLLSQLLSNLVANACQHGERATPVLVRVDGRDAETLSLEVRNSGRIAPALVPMIFDPLRHSERKAGRSRAGGLGLGLFISQQICVAHGGSISADSTDGKTTFRVELPRHSLGEVRR